MPPLSRRKRRLSQFMFILSLIFFIFGLINLGWVVWPMQTDAVQFTIPAGVLAGAPAGTTYASLAEYALRVSWPQRLRLGDTETLTVTLQELSAVEGSVVDHEAQVFLVEPSLINLVIDPPGRMQANLAPGQDLTLTWDVAGEQNGTFTGKVLVSFGFYDESLDELVPVPIAVVDTVVRVSALWGLERGLALWFGVVGLVLWGALFLLGRVAQEK